MSLINKIKDFFQSTPAQPAILFGRYCDNYRSKEKQDTYDKAVKLFKNERYIEAFVAFFEYLTDEKEDNVHWQHTSGGIQFQIYQGSRIIHGSMDAKKVRATGLIAKAEVTNVAFMRRLMEFNHSLEFCRFALTPDDCIAVVFDSYIADSSPQKLYSALRELCIHADKHDDLLLDEFKNLRPAPHSHIIDIPEQEKEVKYAFFVREINRAFETLDTNQPDINLHSSAYAYLLLWLVYKLDYLLRPEGYMMETLEKIHSDFFSTDNEKNLHAKIQDIRKSLQKLLDRPKSEHFKEMYRTRNTFGLTTPVSTQHIFNIIDSELPKMEWYKKNEHYQLALATPGFIAGYLLFNFALPQPLRDTLHLLMQLMEPEYFRDLGFQLHYFDKQGVPRPKAIKRAVKDIAARHREKFPRFKPDTQKLKFDGLVDFAHSYLTMLSQSDLSPKEQ